MGKPIVAKRTASPTATIPAPQQNNTPNPVSEETRKRALGSGLETAHDSLLCLLDIGEHYERSLLSNETMRTLVLNLSTSAENGADCLSSMIEGLEGDERKRVKEADTFAQKSADTMERLREFFYNSDSSQASCELILAMVKPAGINLERAIHLLDPERRGFDAFTSEFGADADITAQKPQAVSHSTEAAGGSAAVDAIQKVHGELHALLDLGKQSDLWPCTFITLGEVLCPLVAAMEKGLATVEGFMPDPRTPQAESAMSEIMKALEYAEALSFFSKYLLAGEAANFDSEGFEENKDRSEYWSGWTKDRLLSCLGGIVVSLVHRIALHCDRACEALGEKHQVIDLDHDLRNPIK